MPQTNNFDMGFWLVAGILILFFFILFLYALISYFIEFYDELRYLCNEINQTDGAERKYWMRKKRRLWLSLIPFVKYR